MKKLTLILLSILMIVTLAACGNKCEQHVYDDCADIECNVCGDKRDSMHSWKDADCDTPKTCTVCGKTEGSALGHEWTTPDVDLCEVQSTCSRCGATDGENKEHTPAEDDGDCSTEVKCTVCGDVTTPAGQHTPNADDGNCLTAITCQNCSEVLTAARSEHEANADDGDCTTAVTCKHCTTVLTEAKSAHEASEDDGDCTTDIICKHCEQVAVAGNASHTPNADDGNCLTAITCSVCGTTTTPAKDSHTGGTATCTEKAVCTVCSTAYGAIDVNNHIDENTDHTCDRECGKTDIGTHADSAEDNDHVCDYGCKAILEDHKGGEATCMHGKLCEVCGNEYDTVKDSTNHVSENYTYTDNGDGTHTKTHECGVVINEAEAHVFVDGKCDCGAYEITIGTVSVTPWAAVIAGDNQRTWEQGDSFTLHLFNQDDPTKTEVHTVTYDGEKWSMPISSILPAYFVAYMGDGVTVTSPTEYSVESFEMTEDQSDADKLKATDVVIAMGTVSGDAALDLLFEHYYAKVTFNVVLASQFNPETDTISEFFVVTCDGDYVKPYIDGNSYTALVPANPYFKAGVHFALVTINGERFEVLIPDEYANPNGSLVAGTHYTFDRKLGKDRITVEQAVMTDMDSPFGDGWHNEIDLRVIGTQAEGKTAWENGDQIIITFTSPSFGTQYGTLTYDGTWSTDVSFSYLENETPTVSAIYAPCYEVVDGNMQLKDGMQLGMTEYISAACSITDGTLNISFEGVTRNYSRLRISTLPGQTLTVTTTGFTPAGATAVANDVYTLTADENGNIYLYGTFAVGATVSVKQGEVTLAHYTFSADKHPEGTKSGINYALDAMPVIDGTLGGKTTATEEDLTAMVELFRSYIENGMTTIIVTGNQPAKLLKSGYLTPVVSLAFEQLTSVYQDENIDIYWGTVDLIYQDVTEIVEYEFYCCDVLKSITLPNVTTVGDRGFWACYYLETLTFGSVVTNITDNSGEVFYDLGYKIDGCNLVLNAEQVNVATEYQPNIESKTWWNTEWKSITLK